MISSPAALSSPHPAISLRSCCPPSPLLASSLFKTLSRLIVLHALAQSVFKHTSAWIVIIDSGWSDWAPDYDRVSSRSRWDHARSDRSSFARPRFEASAGGSRAESRSLRDARSIENARSICMQMIKQCNVGCVVSCLFMISANTREPVVRHCQLTSC